MSNKAKTQALGMNFGTAGGRLRKLIMWSLVQETNKDVCFQCGELIVSVDDLSIEHKEPWQGAIDPKAAFFDLTNIAFSHLSCNSGAGNGGPKRKERCGNGHLMIGDNVYQYSDGSRDCKSCRRWKQERYRNMNRSMLADKERKRYRRIAGVD